MTHEALKKMYQLLLTEPHATTLCNQLERIAREALADHAMQEVQRLGQEIEQCQCPECQIKPHASDCAVHSEPAYPKGKCDCGAQPEQELVAIKRMKEWIEYLKRKSDFGQHMKIPSEMSAGACWELAIELEQFINTAPPQRTWVGLTEQEHTDIAVECGCMSADWVFYGAAVERKVKEKNT